MIGVVLSDRKTLKCNKEAPGGERQRELEYNDGSACNSESEGGKEVHTRKRTRTSQNKCICTI